MIYGAKIAPFGLEALEAYMDDKPYRITGKRSFEQVMIYRRALILASLPSDQTWLATSPLCDRLRAGGYPFDKTVTYLKELGDELGFELKFSLLADDLYVLREADLIRLGRHLREGTK